MSLPQFAKTAFAASMLLLGASQANAAGYTFTDLNGSALYSTAKGINASGQVVGTMDSVNGRSAARWDKGVATELRHGGKDGYGAGINDAGQVAAYSDSNYGSAIVWSGTTPTVVATRWQSSDPESGSSSRIATVSGINNRGAVIGSVRTFSRGSGGYTQGAVWSGGWPTYVGEPEFSGENRVRGINDAGQVVGMDDSYMPYMWQNGLKTMLPNAAGADEFYGDARAINNLGQAVGYQGNWDSMHATLWSDGKAIALESLPDGIADAIADALNNTGQIVGTQSGRALLWEDGKVTDLNSFLGADLLNDGWRLAAATGINDQGWIVGNMVKGTGSAMQTHAFMLTPVPEPETYAMLLAGLGLMGFVARRRRA